MCPWEAWNKDHIGKLSAFPRHFTHFCRNARQDFNSNFLCKSVNPTWWFYVPAKVNIAIATELGLMSFFNSPIPSFPQVTWSNIVDFIFDVSCQFHTMQCMHAKNLIKMQSLSCVCAEEHLPQAVWRVRLGLLCGVEKKLTKWLYIAVCFTYGYIAMCNQGTIHCCVLYIWLYCFV